MRIKNYTASLQEKMSEFDLWVTPTLGEIRDTPQFKICLDNLKTGFDQIATITEDFTNISLCTASSLTKKIIECTRNLSEDEAQSFVENICGVLLLATGKTDNNLKCQFPLMLINKMSIITIPQKTSKGVWKERDIPRALSIKEVTKIFAQVREKTDFLYIFLEAYLHLIISDEGYSNQLYSVGSAYISQRKEGRENALISSMVIFQSRGSITATQGHIPEEILRHYMTDWGLQEDLDYNKQDVELGDIIGDLQVGNQLKKRKYDFIIPYKSRTEGSKIFIQCQFYAGDSGSVSHKVVDQTDSTREVTLRKFPDAVFVEYLDGAGYFSSLNGDLRKMLSKTTTRDFFQIRTAPLKLRRDLQDINFLMPLEIEHSIMRTDGTKNAIFKILLEDGYSGNEIESALNRSLSNKEIILSKEGIFSISQSRIDVARKYCILDIIANYGSPIPIDKLVGVLLVPGFEIYWGLPQNDTIKLALKIFPILKSYWENIQCAFDDIQWLISKGFVIAK